MPSWAGQLQFLVAVTIGVWIFIQISRNATLSLLSGGTPGKIDWNSAFPAHLTLYAALPVIAMLGIQFPATLEGVLRTITSVFPGAGH